MSEDKILSGESWYEEGKAVIGGDMGSGVAHPPQKIIAKTTVVERISEAIDKGGMTELNEDFDEAEGDWKTIRSADPFGILFLDYKLHKFIDPDLVKKHYLLLEKFWKRKVEIMNTGGNRVAFKAKYGDGTVDNSLNILKRAYEKINSTDGIERYFTELNNARLQRGEEGLKDSIEHMMLDGSADKMEIELCVDRGIKYGLSSAETALIIKNSFSFHNFKPYGLVSGTDILDQLLSVGAWMTEYKIAEAERTRTERESLRIQILPGKYAFTIEEIGRILFDDPDEAKEIIKEDLLKQVVAQKDIVLAREISSITNNTKDIHAAFLQIVYKLNSNLPFPFINEQMAENIQQLTLMFFENSQSKKAGKESITKGYLEIWLKESDKVSHEKLITIRDNAENLDQAFLALVYNFNPQLPYRLATSIPVNDKKELSGKINANGDNWLAAKEELFSGLITAWLENTGQAVIANKWLEIRSNFSSQDIGLESFLHFLDEDLEYSSLGPSLLNIDYPAIQSGKLVQTHLTFTLKNRGYNVASLSFSKDIPGISLSVKSLEFNKASGDIQQSVTLSIDSSVLIKGFDYNTTIIVKTTANQNIQIPISCKVVFPKNSFALEITKYAAIIAIFFCAVRLIISISNEGWLNGQYDYLMEFNQTLNYGPNVTIFGWAFLFFMSLSISGIYYLVKFLKHESN